MSTIEPWSTDDDSYFDVVITGESSCGCELHRSQLLVNDDEPYFAIAVAEFGEPTEYRQNAFDEVFSRVCAAVNATAGISVEALEAGVIGELVEAVREAREALHFHYVEWDGEPEDAVPLQLARSKCDAILAKVKGEAASPPQCPHGNTLANPCRHCEREHREATA